MSFSDFLENELLDHVFGAAAYTAPTGVHIALSTADPLDDNSGLTEPSQADAYSRAEYSNNKTTFTTASAGSLSNAISLTFNKATGSWGTISHFVLMDLGSGGNSLAHGALTTSKAITTDDTAEFAATDLSISLS